MKIAFSLWGRWIFSNSNYITYTNLQLIIYITYPTFLYSILHTLDTVHLIVIPQTS